MNTNTLVASADGPRRGYNFLMETEEEGMATAKQKDTLKNLFYLNIENDELRESHINQLRDISENEARLWIREFEMGMW